VTTTRKEKEDATHFGGLESRLGFRVERILGCLTFATLIPGSFVFRLRAAKVPKAFASEPKIGDLLP
jgi:hypothetical protein